MPLPAIIVGLVSTTALRQAIMSLLSGAAFTLGAAALEKLFDTFVADHKNKTGGTDEDAWSAAGELILELAGGSLVIFLSLRGRLPQRIGDKIMIVLKKKPSAVKAMTASDAGAAVAVLKKVDPDKAKTTVFQILGALSVPVWVVAALGNIMDFATWNNSAYQRTFQNIWGKVGFVPDVQQPGTKILTTTQFAKIYNEFKLNGAIGINDPEAEVTHVFNEKNLGNIIDKLAAASMGEKGKVDMDIVRRILTAATIFVDTEGVITEPTPTTTTANTTSIPSTSTSSSIKIITGVVSNGTLGAAVTFKERPDDLITSGAELKDAAKNNLTAFVTSLPGQFFYEIAIVNTVKTKGGFTQKGQAVQVVSGYKADGSPRYKTIYNKFAVMRIAVTDHNGRAVRLREIILGPVDVVAFQPKTGELEKIAKAITPELFTTDVAEIKNIVTSSPVTVTAPAKPAPSTVTPTLLPQNSAVGQASTTAPASPPASSPTSGGSPASTPQTPSAAPAPAPAPAENPVITKLRNAQNLSEYYAAIGQSLPDIDFRAKLYASLGLGAATLYVGTAEQNTKLLAALKKRDNVG